MWNRDGKRSNVIFSLFNVLYITSRKGCIDENLILLLGVQVFYKSSLGALNPNYRDAGFASRAQQHEHLIVSELPCAERQRMERVRGTVLLLSHSACDN